MGKGLSQMFEARALAIMHDLYLELLCHNTAALKNPLCMKLSDPISVRTLTPHFERKCVSSLWTPFMSIRRFGLTISRKNLMIERVASSTDPRVQADHAAAEEGDLLLAQQSAIHPTNLYSCIQNNQQAAECIRDPILSIDGEASIK